MAKQNQFLVEGLFGFDGRFRRSEYWIASLGVGFVRFVVLLIAAAVMGLSVTEATRTTWLRLGLDLVFLWPSAAIAIKRGHDRNRSALVTGVLMALVYGFSELMTLISGAGNAMLTGGIALLGCLVLIYMFIDYGLIDGTKGPNRYGPSPKGIGPPQLDVAATFD